MNSDTRQLVGNVWFLLGQSLYPEDVRGCPRLSWRYLDRGRMRIWAETGPRADVPPSDLVLISHEGFTPDGASMWTGLTRALALLARHATEDGDGPEVHHDGFLGLYCLTRDDRYRVGGPYVPLITG